MHLVRNSTRTEHLHHPIATPKAWHGTGIHNIACQRRRWTWRRSGWKEWGEADSVPRLLLQSVQLVLLLLHWTMQWHPYSAHRDRRKDVSRCRWKDGRKDERWSAVSMPLRYIHALVCPRDCVCWCNICIIQNIQSYTVKVKQRERQNNTTTDATEERSEKNKRPSRKKKASKKNKEKTKTE